MSTTVATTPIMGVDLSAISSLQSGSLTVYNPEFNVGAKVITSDGGEHIYIKCAATITAGDVLQVTMGTGSATGITTALATKNTTTAPNLIAVADVGLAVGQHGWACVRGIPTAGINTAASCNKGTALYTTSTAGQVSTTSTSSCLIAGMETTVTTTGAAVVAGFLNNPVMVVGTVVDT